MKTKRIICLILSMAILFCSGVITSVAATSTSTTNDSTTSNIKWNYNSATKTLTISGKGDMNDIRIGSTDYPWDDYNDEATTIIINSGITSIGKFAFNTFYDVTSITIPDTVTHIDEFAIDSFKLTSIYIPKSVSAIKVHAISGSHLESIDVDKNNKKYSSVDGIVYNKNKTEIVQFPEGREDTSFTIPNTVKTIGEYAFYSCDNIKSITIPNSVTAINTDAFFHCVNLTTVKLGNSIETIASGAFGCCSITTLNIPKSCKKLGETWLFECEDITSINVHKDNKYYCSENGILYNKNKTELLKYTSARKNTSFTVPSYVKTIGIDSFYGSVNLQSINIPNSVTKIDNGAFERCINLKSVRIPDQIHYLGMWSFSYCVNLESISLGNNITSISSIAFSGDKNLKYITFRGKKSQWNSIDHINEVEEFKNCTIRFELKENEFYANKSLKNVNITNKNHIVTKGKAYSAKLTPKKGYVLTNVTVTMNGKTIKTQFNQKTCNIKIKKINGDIAISATAKKAQTISAKSFTKKKKSKPFFINAKAKTRLYYSSSNKKVATVNNNGKVTIKGVGKTTITIKASATSVYAPATRRITITVKK